MPTRPLVYQGPDPKALIERVIDEHGPVRVRPPEKRRVGGLFGFFTKEVYVLTVDVAGASGGEPSAPAPRPADPLGAFLTETADEVVLDGVEHPGAGVSPDGRADGRAVPTRPFSEVLARVASSMGEGPGEFRPARSRTLRAGIPGEPSRDEERRDGEVLDDRPPSVGEAPEDEPPSVGEAPDDEPTSRCDHLPGQSQRWPARRALLRGCGVPEALLPLSAPVGQESSTLETIFARLPAAPPHPRASGGLVAVVGASSGGGGRLAGLLGVAASLRATARSVASVVGCAPDDIALVCEGVPDRAVAAGLLAHAPDEVAALAPGWRRDRVGVAVVYAPSLGDDQGWARAVLRAMRPSQVVGVVSATTKTEDIERWMAAVGGVDSLALVDAARTATPAAVLATGIPVTSLDDHAATPAAWARLVADRVAEG